MNLNEVIANLANKANPALKIHPNDHVNLSQSSNDVFPSAIHISAVVETQFKLLPALQTLESQIAELAQKYYKMTKTGRTHLMDAMPLTFGQEFSGWQTQIQLAREAISTILPELQELALGGTAVGTGINAPPDFAKIACDRISEITLIRFKPAKNYFAKMSAQDGIVRLSGQLKSLACALMKISNDLRWMNSGPLAGLSDIQLSARQPGSSIMPGKVNPVIPESLCMICAQVIGNDTTITIAGQSGNFQLNTMLPLIGQQILYSLKILTNGCNMLALNGLTDLMINQKNIDKKLAQNPILITALTPVLGYELCAKIAKTAYQNETSILDTAVKMTDLSRGELEKLLDPYGLTQA